MTKEIPIGSPIRTKAIINQYFVKAQKSLGQNFLVDLEAIMGIIKAAQIVPGDQVVEIGPGIGSLTEQLLLAGSKVFAYEVDERFVEILDNELPKRVNGKERDALFKLKMQDVLKADFRADLGGFFDLTKPVKVVANLPYYITTPIIFYLHKSVLEFSSLTLMMQKEVAQRLSAKPKNKNYGPLSLAIQRQMEVKLALNVERTCFIPRPHVDSSVVVLKPLENKPDVGDTQHFDWVVKLCFSQRRKTLNNNLKNLIPETEKRQMILAKLGLKPQVRPEELTLEQFGRLAQYIQKNK